MEYTRAKNFNMKTTSFTQTHKPDYSVFHCQKPRRPGRSPYEPFWAYPQNVHLRLPTNLLLMVVEGTQGIDNQ